MGARILVRGGLLNGTCRASLPTAGLLKSCSIILDRIRTN